MSLPADLSAMLSILATSVSTDVREALWPVDHCDRNARRDDDRDASVTVELEFCDSSSRPEQPHDLGLTSGPFNVEVPGFPGVHKVSVHVDLRSSMVGASKVSGAVGMVPPAAPGRGGVQ